MSVFMLGYMQMDLTMPLLAHALDARWGIVYVFAVNSISVALLAIPLVNWIIRSRNTLLVMYVSTLLLATSLMFYGLATHIITAMMMMFLFSIAEILFFPSLDSLMAEYCPKGFIGRTFGLLELGGALGGSLSNIVGGFLYHYLSQEGQQIYYWSMLSVPILLLSSVLLWLFFRSTEKQLEPAQVK